MAAGDASLLFDQEDHLFLCGYPKRSARPEQSLMASGAYLNKKACIPGLLQIDCRGFLE